MPTDRDVVLEKFSAAHCVPYAAPVYPRLYCIRMKVTEWAETLGEGKTPDHAWADAARRIRDEERNQKGEQG